MILSVDAARDVLRLGDVADETWYLRESELVSKLQESGRPPWDVVFFSHTLEKFVDPY